MPKPKRQRKDQVAPSLEGLVAALTFLKVASKDGDHPYQSHVQLSNGRAVSFDGVLAAGTVIQDETEACPHLGRLVTALSKCEDQVSITQVGHDLLIRSGRLKAKIPCINPMTVPPTTPDAPAVAVDARLGRALQLAGTLAADSSPRVVQASVWLTSQYAYGTNTKCLFRCEHGITLPGSLVIPKVAIKAVHSSGKEITQLGASANSVTFWFADGSWIKSQVYGEPWPEDSVLSYFSKRTAPVAIPAHFFEAIEAVSPFGKSNCIYMDGTGIRSDLEVGDGASYEVSDLPDGAMFDPALLILLEPFAETMDLHSVSGCAYAYGVDIVAVVAGMAKLTPAPKRPVEKDWEHMTREELDKEIPF